MEQDYGGILSGNPLGVRRPMNGPLYVDGSLVERPVSFFHDPTHPHHPLYMDGRPMGPVVIRHMSGLGDVLEPGTLITEGGRLMYVVKEGDWPAKIAERYTGQASNWPQLIAANPQKKTAAQAGKECSSPAECGNFASLFAGEKLYWPEGWPTETVAESESQASMTTLGIIGLVLVAGGYMIWKKGKRG
jgi:hypothetical protein